MKCPVDGECKEIIELVDKIKAKDNTLYGSDGTEGLVGKIREKADKSCLSDYWKKPHIAIRISIVSLILIPSALTILNLIRAQDIAEYAYAKKNRVDIIDTKQQIVYEKIGYIQDNLARLAKSQETLRSDMGKGVDEIKRMILKLDAYDARRDNEAHRSREKP